jgi:hypothetical protein
MQQKRSLAADFRPKDEFTKLFRAILKEHFEKSLAGKMKKGTIGTERSKLVRARDMLIRGLINELDYEEIISLFQSHVQELQNIITD